METMALAVSSASAISSQKKEVKVFVVDDDPMYRMVIEHSFRKYTDYRIYSFKTGEECFKHIYTLNPDIIVLDYCLNNLIPNAMNGLEILKRLNRIKPQLPVFVLSGQKSIPIAINCMKYGASDYILKNESAFIRLKHIITRILDNIKLKQQSKQQEKYSKIIVFVLLIIGLSPVILSHFMSEIIPLITILLFLGVAILFTVVNQKKYQKKT